MKASLFCFIILICTVGFMGSTDTRTPPTEVPVEPIIVKQIVIEEPKLLDIHISEYPPPLDILGNHKYHVVINDRLIGMPDEKAETLVKKYGIKPYSKQEFYTRGLDSHGIWARTISSETKDKKLTKTQ